MQPRTLKWTAGVVIVGVIGTALFLRMKAVVPPKQRVEVPRTRPIDTARNLLNSATDLATCRRIVEQLNNHLSHHYQGPPPTLSDAARDKLRKDLGLDADELKEVSQPSFTPLDSVHLETSLLLRDAANVVLRPEGKAGPPEQEAATLFAWVVRQVDLGGSGDPAREPQVPQRALRYGVGSSLMRSLLFLGLLEQLGHDGCLLALTSKAGESPRYWACGVLGSGGKVYLFDPRLGLPLPGPDGQGIATLGDVRVKDSPVLRQLDLGPKQSYDVTAEQAAASEIHLAPPLSALAPRMRLLERELLPAAGRLSADVEGATERFRKALKAIDHPGEVRVAGWAVRLQRNFQPEEDGGVDKSKPGRAREQDRAVVLSHLESLAAEMPEAIRPPRRPEQWGDQPLRGIFQGYSKRIVDFFFGPDQPRDRLLRGQLDEAGQSLGPTADLMQIQVDRLNNNPTGAQLLKWYEEASSILAKEQFDRLEELIRKYGPALDVLIQGASARALLPHVVFLQATVKQEEAERLQQRVELKGTDATAELMQSAEEAWKEAGRRWQNFLYRHGAAVTVPVAQRLSARSQQKRAELAWLRARKVAADQARLTDEARTATQDAINRWQDVKAEQGLAALGVQLQVRRLQRMLDEK